MRTAGALLLASLALAAYSGGGGEGDDAGFDGPAGTGATTAAVEPGSGGAANESPACRLLTTAEVGDLFGQPATVVPADRNVPLAGGADTCLWEASIDGGRSPTIYQLQLSVFSGSGALDPRAWGEAPETIEGLGDEAFLVRAGVLGTTAGYRSGHRSVVLSYAIPLGEDAPDSAAQADQVVELLRTVDARLPSS
jgi:hypothetical protein